MRKSLPILALLSLLAGCGGGSSGNPAWRGGDTATVTLAWPARARLVPLTANSAVVALSLNGKEAGRKTVARVGDGASTGSATFSALAAGRYLATVWTYPTKDGTGVASALGSALLTVGKGNATLAVSPASTVTQLLLAAPAASVKVGETLALTATAKDKDGAMVPLAVDGISERIAWSVSPAGAAAILGDGATVVLTGAAPGDATVGARLKVKDDGTFVEARLPVRVALGVGLETRGWPISGGGYGRNGQGHGPAPSGAPGFGTTAGKFVTNSVVVGPDGAVYTVSDKLRARGAVNWEVETYKGSAYRGLALTQGGVLLQGGDGGLKARDASTGALLWRFDNGTGSFAVGRDGAVYANVPTEIGGSSYLDTTLYALDAATGTTLWAKKGSQVQAVGEDGALYGTVTEYTYKWPTTTANDYIRAFDPSSGALRWSYLLGSHAPASAPTVFPALSADGDAVYATTSFSGKVGLHGPYRAGASVLALNASDGSRRWTAGFTPHDDPVSPRVYGSIGRAATRGGRVFAQWGGSALALDAATGAPLWEVPAGHGGAVATAADGTVYCALGTTANGGPAPLGLLALDPASGAARWRLTLGGVANPGDIALAADGTIVVPTSLGLFTVR